jgi:hypothetical protein
MDAVAGQMIKISGGVKTDLYEEYAANVAATMSSESQGWDLSSALANLQLQRRKIRLAAMTGNLAELRCAGINLESVVDHHRRSLLHIAAAHGQLEVAQLLVKLHPGLVGAHDLSGMSALDCAVEAGHEGLADLLVAAGGGLDGERLREQLVLAVEECDVTRFRGLFKYARSGREAVAEATDTDGRSLMLICLSLRSSLREGEDGACELMHQELLKCCGGGKLHSHDSSCTARFSIYVYLVDITSYCFNYIFIFP